MFTGIITDIGTIVKAEAACDLRLSFACGFAPASVRLGDSIACNGVCLTVVEFGDGYFIAELSAETVACTAPNQWQLSKKVNLERALKLGDTLDGHIVSGHVDGFATILAIEDSGDSHILTLLAPPELSRFIAQKGSVTLDGVSLTVNKVDGDKFWVNIIPHTWKNTTLGERKVGDQLNLEIDMLARYTARLLGK